MRRAAGVAGAGAAHLAAVLAPYVLWATFAYRRFCVDLGYTPAASGTATVASLPAASAAAAAAAAEWCHRPLPDLYAHVQSKYWGVGALRYYQWRQAPNFALAAPALGLCASACLAALAALRPTTAPPTAASSTGGGGDKQRMLSARQAAARRSCRSRRASRSTRGGLRSDCPYPWRNPTADSTLFLLIRKLFSAWTCRKELGGFCPLPTLSQQSNQKRGHLGDCLSLKRRREVRRRQTPSDEVYGETQRCVLARRAANPAIH